MKNRRQDADSTGGRLRRPAIFNGAALAALLLSGVLHAGVPSDAEKLQWAQKRVTQLREARLRAARLRSARLESGRICSEEEREREGRSWLALLHRLRPEVGAPVAMRDASEVPSALMRREDLAVFHYAVEAPVEREDGICERRVLARPSFDPRLGIDSRKLDPRLVGVRFRQDAHTGRALGRTIVLAGREGVREVELPEGSLPSRLTPFELFPLAPQVEFSGAWTRESRFVRPGACSKSVRLDEVLESWLSESGRGRDLGIRAKGSRVEADDFWGRPVVMCVDSEKPWPIRWRTSFGSALLFGWNGSSQSTRHDRAGE